jgi:hypothetical protein
MPRSRLSARHLGRLVTAAAAGDARAAAELAEQTGLRLASTLPKPPGPSAGASSPRTPRSGRPSRAPVGSDGRGAAPGAGAFGGSTVARARLWPNAPGRDAQRGGRSSRQFPSPWR